MSTSISRLAVGLVAVAAAAGALLLASPSRADTASADAVACTLIPASKLLATLGLGQVKVMRNYDKTAPASEAVDTECGVVAWSGPVPKSLQAAFQLAKTGRGAQVGVETWAPHEGSPDVQRWIDRDYEELTGRFLMESLNFPGVLLKAGASKSFQPPRLGHDAAGFTGAVPAGLAKGLVVAIGCWWEDKSSSAICLFDEEAAGKPVVAHLNKLARVAVAKFL